MFAVQDDGPSVLILIARNGHSRPILRSVALEVDDHLWVQSVDVVDGQNFDTVDFEMQRIERRKIVRDTSVMPEIQRHLLKLVLRDRHWSSKPRANDGGDGYEALDGLRRDVLAGTEVNVRDLLD